MFVTYGTRGECFRRRVLQQPGRVLCGFANVFLISKTTAHMLGMFGKKPLPRFPYIIRIGKPNHKQSWKQMIYQAHIDKNNPTR